MRIVPSAEIVLTAARHAGLWFHPQVRLCLPESIVSGFKTTAGNGKILSQVKIVSDELLLPYLPAAASLSSETEEWLYLACALKENALIWSETGFEGQNRVKTTTTKELETEIGRL